MSEEKPSPVSPIPLPASISLPGSTVFLLSGKHAGRYLHARTTQDVLGLKEGEARLAACLDGQGKLLAMLNILNLEQGVRYLIVSEGGESPHVEQAILAFRVAEQATLDFCANKRVLHLILSTDGEGHTAEIHTLLGVEPEYVLRTKRTDRYGYDVVLDIKQYETVLTSLSQSTFQVSESEFAALRVLGHRPHFLMDIPLGRLVVETPLREAFARKGCYPGQEVVEKVQAYGKAPRVLLSFSISERAPIVGEAVCSKNSGDKVGEVVSVGELGALFYLFARVKTDFANESLALERGSSTLSHIP